MKYSKKYLEFKDDLIMKYCEINKLPWDKVVKKYESKEFENGLIHHLVGMIYEKESKIERIKNVFETLPDEYKKLLE